MEGRFSPPRAQFPIGYALFREAVLRQRATTEERSLNRDAPRVRVTRRGPGPLLEAVLPVPPREAQLRPSVRSQLEIGSEEKRAKRANPRPLHRLLPGCRSDPEKAETRKDRQHEREEEDDDEEEEEGLKDALVRNALSGGDSINGERKILIRVDLGRTGPRGGCVTNSADQMNRCLGEAQGRLPIKAVSS